MTKNQVQPLCLGSTSIYRKKLLEKLGLDFICLKPLCDEDLIKKSLLLDGVDKSLWVSQLALAKSQSIDFSGVLITSDQTVLFENEILGKPKTVENAFTQISRMNNKTHTLLTAVVIRIGTQIIQHTQVSQLTFRKLQDGEISRYIKKDNPLDAAGSYKIEESGLSLFSDVQCDDFSGIQGLPMIWVTRQLKELKYEFY